MYVASVSCLFQFGLSVLAESVFLGYCSCSTCCEKAPRFNIFARYRCCLFLRAIINRPIVAQEIKECAITSMGLLLAHLASDLTTQLPEVSVASVCAEVKRANVTYVCSHRNLGLASRRKKFHDNQHEKKLKMVAERGCPTRMSGEHRIGLYTWPQGDRSTVLRWRRATTVL